jgi:hypothetical protein
MKISIAVIIITALLVSGCVESPDAPLTTTTHNSTSYNTVSDITAVREPSTNNLKTSIYAYDPWGSYVSYYSTATNVSKYVAHTSRMSLQNVTPPQRAPTQVHSILIDTKTDVNITETNDLILQEGYTVTMVSTSGVYTTLSLRQNHEVVDNIRIKSGDTYTYVKQIGNATKLEVIKIHIIRMLLSSEDTATVDGIWQVSESYDLLE